MSKDKLIPELRFPEFEIDGEWKILELNNQIDFQTGYPFKSIHFNEAGNGPRLVKNRDLKSDDGIVYYDGEYSEEYIINDGDILVGMDGDFTPRYWNKGTALLNQRVGRVIAKNKQSERFFEYFLSLLLQEIEKNTARTTVKHLSHSVVEKIKAPLPKPKEQQKIAACLSSLDELMAAHNDKLAALKDHKKGLMQNLFPQEGETLPKIRFSEFEGDGEWVEKRLGQLGEFLGGGTPSRKNSEYWTGNIPWISSSDINENDIHNVSISQFINENAIIESATKIIPKGSVLFVSRVGVGKLAINNEELCTSQDFTSFIPTDVLNFFIAYYFAANSNLLKGLSQGTSIKGFSKSDLQDFKILYPLNPKEQQKIASCLSALDALIMAQTEKIEQLQQHKKGLMQGLFPNPSASSGETIER